MGLVYEQGDAKAPKGHALLYFRVGSGAKPWATYLICLPIAIDLVKYMPPFLAPHVGAMGVQGVSVFPFPPVPEEVEGHGRLVGLAQARGDDLLFGGALDSAEVPLLLEQVNEALQEYGQAYEASLQTRLAETAPEEEQASGLEVSSVLYELLGPRDRLAELARLVGRLRFAAEGRDQRQIEEAEREVRLLARHLPQSYRVEALLRAAKVTTAKGAELAGLYLERCYKLADEDYLRVKELEERIRALEPDGALGQR